MTTHSITDGRMTVLTGKSALTFETTMEGLLDNGFEFVFEYFGPNGPASNRAVAIGMHSLGAELRIEGRDMHDQFNRLMLMLGHQDPLNPFNRSEEVLEIMMALIHPGSLRNRRFQMSVYADDGTYQIVYVDRTSLIEQTFSGTGATFGEAISMLRDQVA